VSDTAASAMPASASVTAFRIDILAVAGDTVTLTVHCSAGFYVRSLAHDLGARLAVGGHLASLRRTRTGDFTVEQAVAFDTAEHDPRRAAAAVIGLRDMLPNFPAVTLTPEGVRRAINGCQLGPADTISGFGVRASGLGTPDESRIPNPKSRLFRLLDPGGALVGIGRVRIPNPESQIPNPWSLHPAVVLM